MQIMDEIITAKNLLTKSQAVEYNHTAIRFFELENILIGRLLILGMSEDEAYEEVMSLRVDVAICDDVNIDKLLKENDTADYYRTSLRLLELENIMHERLVMLGVDANEAVEKLPDIRFRSALKNRDTPPCKP